MRRICIVLIAFLLLEGLYGQNISSSTSDVMTSIPQQQSSTNGMQTSTTIPTQFTSTMAPLPMSSSVSLSQTASSRILSQISSSYVVSSSLDFGAYPSSSMAPEISSTVSSQILVPTSSQIPSVSSASTVTPLISAIISSSQVLVPTSSQIPMQSSSDAMTPVVSGGVPSSQTYVPTSSLYLDVSSNGLAMTPGISSMISSQVSLPTSSQFPMQSSSDAITPVVSSIVPSVITSSLHTSAPTISTMNPLINNMEPSSQVSVPISSLNLGVPPSNTVGPMTSSMVTSVPTSSLYPSVPPNSSTMVPLINNMVTSRQVSVPVSSSYFPLVPTLVLLPQSSSKQESTNVFQMQTTTTGITMQSSVPVLTSGIVTPTPLPSPTTPTMGVITTKSTDSTPTPDALQILFDRLGLIITALVCIAVCFILTLLCCFLVCCCVCVCRGVKTRKIGYRKAEVLGDYHDDDNITGRRFNYNPIPHGPVTESFELATLGSALEEHKRKILPGNFKKHLDGLWMSDCAGLREEFDALEISKVLHASNVANLHSEIQKNKDFRLVPYDHNRVKLKEKNPIKPSDYINASYIRAPNIDQLFVAAQAPMDNTISEFWQVVTEQNISNIVMLVPTGLEQQVNALPSEATPVKKFGQFEVSFEAEEHEMHATFRRFKVTNELGYVKHVVHGHFTQWLVKSGVPKFHHSFVNFITSFKRRMILDNSPIMAYSLTGNGQTGVFIATYTLMEVINMSLPFSVFDTVYSLLDQRVCIVQTLEEYRFLYLLVLELICDTTSLLAREFPEAFRTYVDSLRDSYRSTFHQQFSELDYQVEKTHSRSQEDALNPINRSKNATPIVMPYDDTRVPLFSEYWESGDYINASYIDGHKDPQYFIATLHPVRETILEFLQMVYQCSAPLVILLATEDEYALLETGLDGSVCYWADEKQGFGMYSVENLGSADAIGTKRNKIKITNHSEKSSHTFIQYICVNFLDNNKPTNSQPIIHLSEIINKFKQEYKNSPVVVHCWDGVGKTGVLMACCLGIQQIMAEERVDMFHIVKAMRRGREKMVSPVDLYIVCFDIMKDYIVKSGQSIGETGNAEFTVRVSV